MTYIGGAVGANGKTAQKWPKKYQISKWAENPSKSGKRTQKWHFGCRNENFKTTFISPTSLKNNGIAFGFKRFPLLGGFSTNLEIWYFFGHF